MFPIIYRGEVFNDCVDVGGKSQCKVSSGAWAECAAAGATPAPSAPPRAAGDAPVTVDGDACVFPLIYRGRVYQSDCIDVNGARMCKTASGSFKECAAGAGAPAG